MIDSRSLNPETGQPVSITDYDQVETKFHRLRDGRALAYCEYGDASGHPVFYAHGGPGSRLEGMLFHEEAARHGLRLIAVDRPGMGKSDFLPHRALLDYPTDIASLADALSIDRFGVLEWSGGGAHTTVCGYVIADRLTYNISLAGYTNFGELPGAADMLMTGADRIAVRLAQKQPRLFRLFFELLRLNVKYLPGAYYRALMSSLNESDRKILADPTLKAHFLNDQKEAVIQGGRGVAVDAQVHYVDWGFRLDQIRVKLHVFHGTEDRNVPLAYAEHIAANTPAPNCMYWKERVTFSPSTISH